MEYFYTTSYDDQYYTFVSKLDDLESIVEQIAEKHLNDDSEEIADVDRFGLVIELFDRNKNSIGEFEIGVEWMPSFTAHRLD